MFLVPKNVPRTKRWDWENHLFKVIIVIVIPVSHFLSHLLVPSLLFTTSSNQTLSDGLRNRAGSKSDSTLLDLRPLLSSKWFTSVITLQPEWETRWRGRETGWQTQTWRGRGNAALIIHTYRRFYFKKKEKKKKKKTEVPWWEKRGLESEIEREKSRPKWWGIPRAVVHSEIQGCASLGP